LGYISPNDITGALAQQENIRFTQNERRKEFSDLKKTEIDSFLRMKNNVEEARKGPFDGE